MNKLKLTCFLCKGKCCVGNIEVYPEDSTPAHLHKNGYMLINEQNKCIALIDGLCSIYDNRPDICKRFIVDSPCCNEFYCDLKTEHKCISCNLINNT
jgi:Fe-S-cluster containining protein